jgi:ribonuclease D
MTRKPALISDPTEVSRIAAALQKEPVIAVDTEFIRETTFFPKTALLQFATDKEAWLVDPLACTKEQLKPVLDVLVNPDVIKIFHAAFADQECFYWSYGVLAEPVLDTAVAGALLGLGDNAGLAKLLREILNVHLPKGRARAKWLARPLPFELLNYAVEDVVHLVELGRRLMDRLKAKGRLDWALSESRYLPEDFDPAPEDIAARLGKNSGVDGHHYAVLAELVRWREDRAKKANLPRNWVSDNETLIALAKVRPKNIEELKSFRGLSVKEVERSGTSILDAIKKGLTLPKQEGGGPRFPQLDDKEEHLLDFIQTYVSFLASKHEIAPRYLLSAPKAIRLLHKRKDDVDAWVNAGILTEAARALIGEELKALLAGKRALGLKGDRVEIFEL